VAALFRSFGIKYDKEKLGVECVYYFVSELFSIIWTVFTLHWFVVSLLCFGLSLRVSSFFSFLSNSRGRMDVCDFISRRLPEEMIVAQQIALQGTNDVPQEYEPNLEMVTWICEYFEKGKAAKFLPPLYLQHDGHSR
jgi:hypothetical protein